MTLKVICVSSWGTQGEAIVSMSTEHLEFGLHVALECLFLFGFCKSALWQGHYSMYKSDFRKILAPKTCRKMCRLVWIPSRCLQKFKHLKTKYKFCAIPNSYCQSWISIKHLAFFFFFTRNMRDLVLNSQIVWRESSKHPAGGIAADMHTGRTLFPTESPCRASSS